MEETLAKRTNVYFVKGKERHGGRKREGGLGQALNSLSPLKKNLQILWTHNISVWCLMINTISSANITEKKNGLSGKVTYLACSYARPDRIWVSMSNFP